MKFYATTAANMPNGSGYWEIHAEDEGEARGLAFEHIPEGRWAFLYPDLSKVHERDRKRHGVIGDA